MTLNIFLQSAIRKTPRQNTIQQQVRKEMYWTAPKQTEQPSPLRHIPQRLIVHMTKIQELSV